MGAIKCKLKRESVWSYLYTLDDAGLIYRHFLARCGGKVTAEITEDQTLVIMHRDQVMGERDEWKIKYGQVVVFDENVVKVISERDFNERYERVDE